MADSPLDLRTLVVEHADELFRYAWRLAGNAADAEDLVQQTFLIAHEKLAQLRQAESVRGWLFVVLRHAFCRQKRSAQPLPLSSIDLDVDSLSAALPEEPSIDPEELRRALDELPDDHRILLLSFYFEELSYKQIAVEQGLPIGTVMSRLSRAKNHLRRRLIPLSPDSLPQAAPRPAVEGLPPKTPLASPDLASP